MPPAELIELRPGLVLRRYPDDLLCSETALAHLSSSRTKVEQIRLIRGPLSGGWVTSIAPSTDHRRALEAREPDRASARSKTDAALQVETARVWEENRQLCGARKIWHARHQEGVDVARCSVERLLQAMGIEGVVRGRKIVTTNPDAARPCPDDKVDRMLEAERPIQPLPGLLTRFPSEIGSSAC